MLRIGQGAHGANVQEINAAFDALQAQLGFEIGTPADVSGYASGLIDAGAYFTRLARIACGLDENGNGTVGSAKPIVLGPGNYLLKAWNPTDALGYALPVRLVASSPGSVRISNRLSLSNVSSGAIDIDYSGWQDANKVQMSVTSVTEGYSVAAFGFASASSTDDTVSILNVADSTGIFAGDLAVIHTKGNLPHTNSSSNKSRIAECFRVLNVDATHVYVQGRLCFHDYYETEIYVTRYDTRRNFQAFGIRFDGAASTIGRTTATPSQLDRGLWGLNTWSIVSITRSGTTATAITLAPHLLSTGHYVHITGANEDNYNVTVGVTVVDPYTFTFVMPTKNDAAVTFGTAPGSAVTPATGTIVYADAFANLDVSTALGSAITVRNGPGSRLENCEFSDLWTMGVRWYNSPEWRVTNCTGRGLPNAGTQAQDYSQGRLGYGINIYGHSGHGVMEGGTWRNCRHVVTSGGINTSTYTPTNAASSSSWTKLGIPTLCLIKDVNAFDAWGVPFDVHEEGSDITFQNCWAINPQRGPQGGSYTGTGFQIRCRNMRVINCGQRGGQQGIRVAAVELLGTAALYGASSIPAPLTYTITSLTQAAGVATFVHGTGINAVNTGAHVKVGDMIRLRGSDQENYNVTVQVLTYTESTKTGTFTLPTKDDLGATFVTLPANVVTPATGTMTLRPFARTQHVVQNFFFEGLRKGKSGGILLDSLNGISWKNKVLVKGITGIRTQNLINADQDTVCDADDVMASQLIYDSSSDQSGAVVGTQANAIVHVGKMMLDVTDSLANAPGIYPARMSETSSVMIGTLILKQHPTYLACPRVFEDKDNVTGKFAGLGKLVYQNPGALNPSTGFAIIQIGREPHFTWLGGGEELYIPTHTRAITNGSVTVAQRLLGQPFILRRAAVLLDANAVGDVTVDVLMAGATIFGANKIVTQAGQKQSLANATQPTLSKMLLTDGAELTVTVISASGAETAKINGVAASGFYV